MRIEVTVGAKVPWQWLNVVVSLVFCVVLLACSDAAGIPDDCNQVDTETDQVEEADSTMVDCAGLFCLEPAPAGSCKVVPYFCAIDEVCVPAGAFALPNVCAWCDPSVDPWTWSVYDAWEGKEVGPDLRCYHGQLCPVRENCEGKTCGEDDCGGFCGDDLDGGCHEVEKQQGGTWTCVGGICILDE